jgi:malic enzyme
VASSAAIAPAYGGINLEDIAAPRCFEIETRLRELLDIPVFHDDQHGTAICVLAALTNALRVVGKELATYGSWCAGPARPARPSSSCCCARASATSSRTTGRVRCTAACPT